MSSALLTICCSAVSANIMGIVVAAASDSVGIQSIHRSIRAAAAAATVD